MTNAECRSDLSIQHCYRELTELWLRSSATRTQHSELLDLDFGADVLELLLDRGGLVLRDAFLDRLGRALDEVLRFLQSEAGDFADDLDDVDLVAAHFGQRRGELGLLFRRRRRASRRAA